MKERTDCPACAGTRLAEIYRIEAIPVQSCILLESREEAQAFPRAPLILKFCGECGFIFNSLFDLGLIDYNSITEESQHFSGTFNRFAEQLVAEIAENYPLHERQTLEIGCGKGDFLQELVVQTGTRGLGIDPGFIPKRLPGKNGDDIAFQREYFDPVNVKVVPDFIVCRHTLEHIPNVGLFMSEIAKIVGERHEVGVLFETPDVERVLVEGAFWDIYYEHCSYFTRGSHARLFRREGFDVTRQYLAYNEQYIIQYAHAGGSRTPLAAENDLERSRSLAARFQSLVARKRAGWREFVCRLAAEGKLVAIWGGGSKGVAFLTTNNFCDEVGLVVDINPHKQGKFLPGSGHEVVSPEALKNNPPDTVIAMNPIYLGEIGAQLREMGLQSKLVAV